MAKLKNTILTPRTALVISQEAFKSALIEQISKGAQLSSTDIQTDEQLDSLEKDFNLWDDYNVEFFKSTFNKPQNEHKYAYESAGNLIGVQEVFNGANIYSPKYRYKTLVQ